MADGIVDTNPINANMMLSTPQGYATPEQIKELRAYSKFLGTPGEGMAEKVYNTKTGLANMAAALMGGLGARQSAIAEQRNVGDTATRTMRSITPTATEPNVDPVIRTAPTSFNNGASPYVANAPFSMVTDNS